MITSFVISKSGIQVYLCIKLLNMYQITGKIHLIRPEQVVSDKFRKREFVLVTTDKYPQYLSFQLTQNNCEQLNNYSTGDTIKVNFDVRGREWKAPTGEIKYFNSLEAWRLEREGSESSSSQPQETFQDISSGSEPADDLPF